MINIFWNMGKLHPVRSIVAGALACASVLGIFSLLLAGCAGSNVKVQAQEVSVFPQVLLPSGLVVAWDMSVTGDETELHTIESTGTHSVGMFKVPGYSNRGIDSSSFASTFDFKSASGWHEQTYIYDLKAHNRRLITGEYTLSSFASPASSDGRMLLVRSKKPNPGLAVIATASGKSTLLLDNVWPHDAVWVNKNNSILCACTLPPKSDVLEVISISATGRSRRVLWTKPFASISALRISPAGDSVTYRQGSSLKCESLNSRKTTEIVSGLQRDPECIWSGDGTRLAILTSTKGKPELLLYDAVSGKTTSVYIQYKGSPFVLGWLPSNRTLVINLTDVDAGKVMLCRVSIP